MLPQPAQNSLYLFNVSPSGDRFVTNTTTPGILIAPLPWRYLARNPEAATPSLEAPSGDHRAYSLAPPHPWRQRRAADVAAAPALEQQPRALADLDVVVHQHDVGALQPDLRLLLILPGEGYIAEQLAQARFQPAVARLIMPPPAGTATTMEMGRVG